MLFNSNDINLGNYEEFFILYMDNELTDEQRKMVEEFLLVNPDLQAELEILRSTKLPAEGFAFNKESLFADSMKLNAVDEDLLLYIDNELDAERKKIVELELASNPSYQWQYRHLLQTKLDTAEVVAYPDKKELYHRKERVVAFRPWMRLAAAVMLVAAMGVLYFTGDEAATFTPGTTAVVEPPAAPAAKPVLQPLNAAQPSEQAVAGNTSPVEHAATLPKKEKTGEGYAAKHAVRQVDDLLANHTAGTTEEVEYMSPYAKATTAIAADPTTEATTASFDPSKQIFKKSGVTSALSQRNTTINATEPTVPDDVASNNERKGSFKSFLRKATRLIERKTGIDATSGDDEELLIGAVAVKLK
ncbi:MAG TPA: hypothetical protein VFS22_07845 [Flavisolibacter sp.]|nr:hypothetical protein [Flavisolibacter sp.]